MKRLPTNLVLVSMLSVSLVPVFAACGGGGGDDDGPDPLPTCPSGNCGKETFRRAVPRSAAVRINGPGQASARNASLYLLETPSSALVEVEEHVAEIDGLVDDIFGDLEEVAGTTPEIESDTEHLWRIPEAEVGDSDELLYVTTTDEATFQIEYLVGPDGFGPDDAEPIIYGTVVIDGDQQADFDLTIDLDALDEVFGEGMSGDIVIAEMPFDGGERELWYDFHEVDFGDGDVENSRTTYWEFDDEGSGALEFVADWDGQIATAFARWDDDGGRYDHHTAYEDETLGLVDEIATSCWTVGGAEVFDGWALIDQKGSYYGELDGEEGSCEFGPVADHPDPGEEFDDLPGEGEWDDLELNSFPE
jgi:hypothetical protein